MVLPSKNVGFLPMVYALKGCGDPCGRAVNIWMSKPSGFVGFVELEKIKTNSSLTGDSWAGF